MEFKKDILIMDAPFLSDKLLDKRIVQLHKDDVIFLNDDALKALCGSEVIHLFKRIPLGELQGMVTDIVWSQKKWWQFWKTKKFLGCHITIR